MKDRKFRNSLVLLCVMLMLGTTACVSGNEQGNREEEKTAEAETENKEIVTEAVTEAETTSAEETVTEETETATEAATAAETSEETVSEETAQNSPAKPAAASDQGWKEIYKNILLSPKAYDGLYWSLADVDQNGIPELYNFTGQYCAASICRIYDASSGRLEIEEHPEGTYMERVDEEMDSSVLAIDDADAKRYEDFRMPSLQEVCEFLEMDIPPVDLPSYGDTEEESYHFYCDQLERFLNNNISYDDIDWIDMEDYEDMDCWPEITAHYRDQYDVPMVLWIWPDHENGEVIYGHVRKDVSPDAKMEEFRHHLDTRGGKPSPETIHEFVTTWEPDESMYP